MVSHANSQTVVSEASRIRNIRHRCQSGDAMISIERARYYTESWEATAGQGLSNAMRVAMAMKHVYANMTLYLDPDDRIAGNWTEYFLGIPIDIERGVFNQVLKSEIKKSSMIRFRLKSMGKGLIYMLRKGALPRFLKNQRIVKAAGTQPLNMDFKTMGEREINPYQIEKADRDELLTRILPKWEGRTLVDQLEREMHESGLYSKDMHDFAVALPGNTSRQVMMLSTCATIATYQGHVILDFDRVLEVGLTGMLQELRSRRKDATLSESQKDFLDSQLVCLEGVSLFCKRLAERIETEIEHESDDGRRRELETMCSICRKVPMEPAGCFREAVQSLWSIKTAVELAHPVNLHCFGRLDQSLYPYYAKDLEVGAITEDQALWLLEELLLKIMSQNIRPESNILGNFYHRFLGSSPVTIGGTALDGTDQTNELTYLFARAAHESRAITNVSVRVGKNTPPQLLTTLAEYLKNGTSSFSLFNDEINIEAMRKRGFSEEDACNYAIMGCVEATCPGKTGSMSANALQLNRLLDITLRNGDSAILAGLIRNEGLKTGVADDFATFEQFLAALYRQADHFIKKIVDGSNLRDRVFAEHLPAPYISAFIDGCLDSGKDVTQGGAVYDLAGISMINSIANFVDSLYTIQNLVFERKKITLSQLVNALDENFVGYEDIHADILKLSGKWGNGDPKVDKLASEVMKQLFSYTYRHRTSRNGPFTVYVISMITHTIDGRLSIASLDGRKAAVPYAASCNPYNVERGGVTAALRSVASLPFEDVMGCAVNMKFHPSAIGEKPETRDKWAALIRTYFALGGSQMQPSCVSTETLKAAQQSPDQYRDLIIKVGGYSTYFVDLGCEIQQEIIERTEHAGAA